MKKIIAFDCDSTLSAIEGVDELARLAGDDIFKEVENLTNLAMDGKVPVEEVFARRLDLIKPTSQQCAQIGQMYLETIEPTAEEGIAKLKELGWECLIISGGFLPCIEPLAKKLGISWVEAVPLHFAPDGQYLGFDENYPTTRSGGKPELISAIKKNERPETIVMVGDGVSDMETICVSHHFIGFFRYIRREKVSQMCTLSASAIIDIPTILEKYERYSKIR